MPLIDNSQLKQNNESLEYVIKVVTTIMEHVEKCTI
jgi:hypothetical protein